MRIIRGTNTMKEYILTVTCAGVFCGAIGLLFDGKNDAGLSKYIRMLCSLCLICVICAPLFSFRKKTHSSIDFPKELTDSDLDAVLQEYDAYVIEQARVDLCDSVAQRIFEKIGIMPLDVDIQFNVEKSRDQTEVSIREAVITVTETTPTLSAYVSELLGIAPEIIVTQRQENES